MTESEFIDKATNEGIDKTSIRTMLVSYFKSVEKQINCLHGIHDSFYIADYLLKNQNLSGDIVEFGCFQGGMSCKIAKIAQLLRKKYFIFDTFSGLNETVSYAAYDPKLSVLGEFKKGMFACKKDEVKNNIKKFGLEKNCVLIEGLIENTLQKYFNEYFCVFIDVDNASVAQFIIKSIWKTFKGPGIFTHEACLSGYMNIILDEKWWQENFGEEPPKLGSNSEIPGLPLAGCLDFLIKDKNYKF